MSVTSSPPPPLTFQTFLEKMRQPSAASLVRRVKSFIASIVDDDDDETADFDNQYAVVKRGRLVQKFLAETEASFTTHPAWRGSSADELEASGEGLEKYVMTKAHARVFGKGPRDAIRDEGLKRRIAALREIIKPEHLDVTESSHAAASWALAESELGKINQFKAPRDKLVCALNTCRIINNTLTTRQGSDGGADDFLPALVYVTLKANPDKLESNLKYIQRFRGESRLVSEAAYFFTNLVSAARFLGRAEAKDFTGLDEETFNATMSAAGALEAIDLDDDEFVEESEEREEEEDAQPRTPISVDEMSAALSALEEKTPPLGRTALIQMEDDGRRGDATAAGDARVCRAACAAAAADAHARLNRRSDAVVASRVYEHRFRRCPQRRTFHGAPQRTLKPRARRRSRRWTCLETSRCRITSFCTPGRRISPSATCPSFFTITKAWRFNTRV
jgi:hypothetical protein